MKILASLILAASLWVAIGCRSIIETGGPYNPTTTNTTTGVVTSAPDKPFLVVESAFSLAYSALDAAFTFEKNNREMLWATSHDIKHALDSIRPKAVIARDSYIRARKLYTSIPNQANLEFLRGALSRVESLSKEAQAAIPK